MEDTKEGLIKSTKKTHKMQLVFKKWEELSKEEVQSIFSLRSEVFIVEQNCPYQDIDGNDEKQTTFYCMKTTTFVDIQEYFQKIPTLKKLHLEERLLKKLTEAKVMGMCWLKNL